jgi:hypothetical protein
MGAPGEDLRNGRRHQVFRLGLGDQSGHQRLYCTVVAPVAET